MKKQTLIFDSAIFYTSNIEKVKNFYKNTIGLKIEYQNGKNYISFMFSNKVGLGIKKTSEIREIPGSQTISIQADNISELFKKMKEKNVEIKKELTDESWGEYFSILDPDKNKIEFIHRR